ncbi:P2Y purinoceptor 8-like [Carassius carassius]|uniref:P2Y purinoceptor 8-like n=1 Tax=Carassius carassius TaxID=217509 RepID=UPI002868A385|nr:P2Y purinoceptor 8-like [Carassius carassius]
MANRTSNVTYTHTIYNSSSYSSDFHQLFLTIVDKCNDKVYTYVRLPIEILTLVVSFPSNVALLWLLVRGKKALSPSEVLGLNLALLNVIFCISLPLDMYISVSVRSGQLLAVSEAISILNLIGCPLLLTSMCVERYLAAAHAVCYMKLGNKWEYRVVSSALIWIVTLGVAVITYLQRLPKLALYLSITLDVFLLIMLACLTGIVHVLCKKGPGEGQTGGRGGSSIKNRALKNALLILIPSTVIYGPLLATAPFIFTLKNGDEDISPTSCIILNLMHTFPSFGSCIGPVFYMSRVKQLACWKKNAEEKQTVTQELQDAR